MLKIFILLITPFLGYPAYFTGVNLVDQLIGEQYLLQLITHESRSQLLLQFVQDWISSSPVFLILFFVITAISFFLTNKPTFLRFVTVIFIFAGLIAAIAYAFNINTANITGISLSCGTFIVLCWFSTIRAGQAR